MEASVNAGDHRGALFAPRILLVLGFIIVASLLGGSSQGARTPLIALELLSLPVGALGLRGLVARGERRGLLGPLVLAAVMVVVPLLQCLPLSPGLWLRASGQDPRFTAFVLDGLDLSSQPLSLNPAATLAAAAALLPPVAMFFGVSALSSVQRRGAMATWLAVVLAGLLLGLVQVTQPDGGWSYLYQQTNLGYPVGWFANRNHEAALLLALIPVAAVMASRAGMGRILGGAFLLVALIGIGAGRSRAGIIMAGPVLILTLTVLALDRRVAARPWTLAMFAGVAMVSAAGVAILAGTPILNRFASDTAPEFRYQAWPLIWSEARLHLPFGSGVGSFDRVYRAIEPLRLVGPTYFNHAHNDFLELWLETGWLGAAILAGFLVWFGVLTVKAWSRNGPSLTRAASVGIVTLASMSWVDYPLRTEALAVLFATFFAMLVFPARDG